MKKLFKLFSVLLMFCLSFSLAGCGNPSEQEDPSLTTQQVVT